MPHIAVLGAGITGITTAYALLDRGYSVTVIDRMRYAAMDTSFANGGQLSACNAEVWNSWTTVFKGLKWMLRSDAPLLVNPKPSLHKATWMAEFLAAIPQYRANTIETVRLAIAARQHLTRYADAEGIAFDRADKGLLHVYRDKAGFDHATKVSALLAEGGLERRAAVGPEEIQAIEPTLPDHFYGGYYTQSDFSGDIHRFSVGLAEACARRGATFVHEADIQAVTPIAKGQAGFTVSWRPLGAHRSPEDPSAAVESRRFDGVVICAGVGSRRLAAHLGDRINVYPVKGYSITVALDDPASQAAAPWVALLDDETKIVTSRLGADRFRIAGTAEFNGINRDIRADRISPLTRWCADLFPDVRTEHAVPWAGLRPMMPNMMPRVGPGRRPGVFYNTGHGHLGWTLSAATAELVADAVLDGVPA